MLHNAVTIACPPNLGPENDPFFGLFFTTPIPRCCLEPLGPESRLGQVVRNVRDTDCTPEWQEPHEARMSQAKYGSSLLSLLERTSLGSPTMRVGTRNAATASR